MTRIGERGLRYSGVKVYDNAEVPTSWVDFDLSAVVGKRRALVYLKIKLREGMTQRDFSFRVDGDTEEVGVTGASAGGCTLVRILATQIGYLLVETSAAGIVEMECNDTNKADIWVFGYVA